MLYKIYLVIIYCNWTVDTIMYNVGTYIFNLCLNIFGIILNCDYYLVFIS